MFPPGSHSGARSRGVTTWGISARLATQKLKGVAAAGDGEDLELNRLHVPVRSSGYLVGSTGAASDRTGTSAPRRR